MKRAHPELGQRLVGRVRLLAEVLHPQVGLERVWEVCR